MTAKPPEARAVSRELVPVQPRLPVAERVRFDLRRLASRSELVAYLVIGLALLLVLLIGSFGRLTPDTRPVLYLAPARALRETLQTWRPDPYLGQPNFDAGSAPMALAIWVIRAFGTPAWVAVRLWRWLLLVAGGAGAALLYHTVTEGEAGPERRRVAVGRVAAALVYAANPYAVVGGATSPILWPYALLPWMLLALAWSLRRPRSWAGPAAFALAFFAMGGTNAGVVPLFMLLGVPCYLVWMRLARRLAWRELVVPTLRCALLALLVSLYWLVPALSARESAASIAFNSEKPSDVAAVSSYAETLRGLGLWLTYGRTGNQLFSPAFAGYVTNPLIFLASFCFPLAAAVAAWRSRSRARLLAALLLAVAVPVMAGLFPTTGTPTPFARLLARAFDHVPGAIAFRTTNKAGAVAALGITLLIALGAAWTAERMGGWGQLARRLVPLGAVVVLVLGTLPFWAGGYASRGFHLPGYWQQAARDLNAGRNDTRVLFLPGEVQSDYRWGLQGPDDLNEALLSRPSVLRSTAPNGSDVQSNFLAALDVPLASGVPSNGMVSAMARYLGASEILVRNDLAWENSGGLPPWQLAQSLATDPGLRLERSYGRVGESTIAPGIPNQRALPPLQTYAVSGAQPIVRAEPVDNALLIDGDSFALPSLQAAGMLAGQPAFRLLGSMSPEDVAVALDDGARIVLTDTNRRRAWDLHHINAGWGPTLTADQSLDGQSTVSLFGDPSAQTVTELVGASSVTATSQGSVFGLVPWGKATAAFDGDPHTAWLTGNFGSAVGQSITLRLIHPVKLDHITLQPVLGGPVQVASVRIHLDGGSIDAAVPAQPVTTVRFPATTTQSVTVEITGTRGGPGLNAVGFWEIGVPGVQVTEIARLPERIRQLTDGLDATGRARLDAAPLDVVLTRQAGDPSTPRDDEERAMNRQFWLPDTRDFTVSGTAEAGPDLPEPVVDQLAGFPSSIVATSSSRLFDSIDVRASAALDGNPDTAWIPGGDKNGVGEWIDLRFPAQTIDHVTVIQSVPKALKGARVATGAELSLNGGKPIPVQLHEGAVTIPVPSSQPVSRLRLTLTKVAGLGSQVRISEIQVGNVHVPSADDAVTKLHGCVQVATVDGTPLKVALKGTMQQLAKGTPVPLTACDGQQLSLGQGEHQLLSAQGWLIDLLHLASKSSPGLGGGATAAPVSAPHLTVLSSSATRTTLTSEPAKGPWYLVLGQGYDPRWRATVDGQPLGPPIVLDGYSVGWRISNPSAHQITVWFAPQRQADLARDASLAALLLVIAVLFAPRLRRRFRGPARAVVPLLPAQGPGPNGQLTRPEGGRDAGIAGTPPSGPVTEGRDAADGEPSPGRTAERHGTADRSPPPGPATPPGSATPPGPAAGRDDAGDGHAGRPAEAAAEAELPPQPDAQAEGRPDAAADGPAPPASPPEATR